jgi:DNA repair protein RadC
VPGLGPARAARIKAAFELGQRLYTEPAEERPVVRSPADAANLLMPEMSLLEQEHLRVVLLDTRNHVLGTPTVYVGNLNTTVIRTCEVFREAIRQNCAAIIVAHNHPTGAPRSI